MRITVLTYLDSRSIVDEKKPAPLYLKLTRAGKSVMINMELDIPAEMWDKKLRMVVKGMQKDNLNKAITAKVVSAQCAINSLGDKADSMTMKELKTFIASELYGKVSDKSCFGKVWESFMTTKQGHTQILYGMSWRVIEQHDDKAYNRKLEEINYDWLTRFKDFLVKKGDMENTCASHLRNIRAVFNYAIDNDITMIYPFRKFKIKMVETAKRNLPLKDIRLLRTMPVRMKQRIYRDMFMLIIYLRGINVADLYNLTEENVMDGRIVYRRAKTNRLYSVKIEPEAQEILDAYKGKTHLLEFADRYTDVNNFTNNFDKALKKLGTWERKGKYGGNNIKYNPYWPKLSSYWARHSWATIAHNDCSVSMDVISQALGHSFGAKVTHVYVAMNNKAVDEANRKVIDAIVKEE